MFENDILGPSPPIVTEFPVQAEPDAQLGTPDVTVPPVLKASEGNVLIATEYENQDLGDTVRGFTIIPATNYFDGLAQCQAYFDSGVVGLFAAHSTYFDAMDDVTSGMQARNISAAEEAVIRKFFPTGEYGDYVLPWESISHNEE